MYVHNFPINIQIQTTTVCNSDCVFCPNSQLKRSKSTMSLEECCSIIEQCRGEEVKTIAPFFTNEPLAYKHLIPFINKVKEVLPNTLILIYTNGGLLTKDRLQALLDTRANFYFHFSLGGVTKEIHEQVYRHTNYTQIIQNIHNFLLTNPLALNPVSFMICLQTTTINQHEATSFKEYWEKYTDTEHINTVPISNRNRDVNYSTVDRSSKVTPCSILGTHLLISSTGDVGICCEDWKPEVVVGNVFEESISSIWHGSRFQAVRKLHLEGRKTELPLCRGCNKVH